LPFLSWATAGSANFVLGYDFSAPYGCFGDALVLNIYKDAAGTTLVYSTAYAGAASIGTGGNTEVIAKQGSQFWGNCLSIFLQRIFFNLDERQRHHERQLCRLRWRDCLRQFFGDLRNRLVSSAPSRLLTSNME
jgi:hypothetical protein